MTGDADRLVPFVPRFVLGWDLTEPGPLHRRIDATVVFVDISGFTAMSERLARSGKVGAEEVTEILNGTFSRLLAVAYENGGSLLKFGGDALLLLFFGPDHLVRGCHAAAGMRRKLRELGKIPSSAGRIGLRMSVGIHSGEVDLFVVGELHREILITGPAASRTVAMESAAAAGEILLSSEAASRLPNGLLGAEKDGGRLLQRTPAPTISVPDVPRPGRAEPGIFLPEPIRRHAEFGGEPEHRLVNLAFVRYEGIDDRVRAEGPEAVAGLLHDLVSEVQRIAAAHAVTFLGTDIDRDGGKMILVAGVPDAVDRAEEQLLRAVRSILDRPLPLPVRIGVNGGHVFAGDVGPAYRRTYTIMGDAVNLAARLMARARPAHAIVAPEVLERSRTTFANTELEPFSVKGKRDPIVAFELGPIEGTRGGATPGEAALLGRDPEIRWLGDALERARSGRGIVAEIVGEPGMGKSRLVEELRWRAGADRVLLAAGEQYAASTPYGVVGTLVRDLLDIHHDLRGPEAGRALERGVAGLAPTLLPWLPLIAIAIDAEVDPTPETERLDEAYRAERLLDVLVDLFTATCVEPTVMVIEDLPWVDGTSLAFLEVLARTASERPWLICLTRRPEFAGIARAAGGHELVLEPLSTDASEDLVRAAGEELSLAPHELSALMERAGGNPLFLEELVAGVQAAGGVGELPPTIEAVIGARIDLLPPAARVVLRYASVLGMTFEEDLLREMLSFDERANVGGLAELRSFLSPEGGGAWRFLHALTRDVAYEGLPFRRRRELHRHAGELLEGSAGVDLSELSEVLALHFELALLADKAWRYSVLAGDRARSKYSSVEAARFYRQALAAGRRLPDLPAAELLRISEALGDTCERAGMYQDAANAYAQARRHASGDRAAVPRLCLKDGVVRLRQGRYSAALRWYTRGLHADPSDPGDAGVRVELGLAYAGVRYYQGRYRDCIEWCERMLPEAMDSGDLGSLAHAYSLLHLAHVHLGSPRRIAYRGLALPLYEELGDLTRQGHVLNNMGIDAYYEGDWSRAIELYERGREALEKAGGLIDAADVSYNIAEILSDQGQLEEAERLTVHILDTYRASRYPVGEALALGNLGRIASRDGRFVEAAEVLEEALDRFSELGDERFAVEMACRLIELCVFMGAHDEALSRIEELTPRVRKLGDVPALVAMLKRLTAYALAHAGRHREAQDVAEDAVAFARDAGIDYELALSLEAVALIAGNVEADAGEALAESVTILHRLSVVATPAIPSLDPPVLQQRRT